MTLHPILLCIMYVCTVVHSHITFPCSIPLSEISNTLSIVDTPLPFKDLHNYVLCTYLRYIYYNITDLCRYFPTSSTYRR